MKSNLFLTLFFLFAFNAQGNQMEEQVLEVTTLNGAVLSDPVLALSNDHDIYLPLLDIAKVLGVRIEQPSAGIFQVYSSENEYDELNFNNCADSEMKVCKAHFKNKETYFLSAQYLKEELEWPITADLKAMQVVVNIGRSSRDTSKRTAEENHPYILTRKKFGYPAARIEATASSLSTNNILNIYETQPLLNHDSDILVSTTEKQTNLRWTLSKEVIEAKESYEIKNYELISTQSLDTKYIFSPTQILGVKFSNFTSDENIFDTQNFYEKGPPRWKVEIYVNEVYLGETTVDLNGDFSFLNVPIFYGSNHIVYRFTSPLGKKLEVDRTMNVTSDFQGKGKTKYQASLGQVVRSSNTQGSALVSYGLTSYISAQLGAAQFASVDTVTEKKYSLIGISYLQPSFSIGVTKLASFDAVEGAWVVTPKMNFGKLLITGEQTSFDNFRTLLINTHAGENLSGLKKLSVLAPLPTGTPINAQLTMQENSYLNSDSIQYLQGRLYTMFPSSSLLLETNKVWPSIGSPDLYTEYGTYSRAFRGKYGFLMQNNRHAKTKLTLEYLVQSDFYFTVSSEAPPNISEGAYVLGANKLIGELQTEASISHSPIETVYSLTLATNLKTNESGIKFSQEEKYRQANIEFFAFVDENCNGKFDASEKPYRRLRILETHRQKDYETDESGLVVVPSLSPYQRYTFQVVKESITNIFLTAQDFQSDFILTPAQQLRVEIPIKPTFDVRGNITNSYFKKLVPLEMVDSNNQVISTTTTSSIGKYSFSDLPGGSYFIRVNENFLKENKLHSEPAMQAIELTGKPGVRSVENLNLRAAQ